ncbi:SdiA-regulated domain-containing protein [Methylotuvimicrobium alcaliphilum]|uniref:SdiA-regulated domain-containing protein n=1 Tax=Methylotuvimicrobium alcaliphilum TaxID=271065 RepID=UPI0006575816|nr:SdiA-regulated domain-containing protein [Methylotuvimicrobium alcaliphilum]
MSGKKRLWLLLPLLLLSGWIAWHFPDYSPLKSGIETEWDLSRYQPIEPARHVDGIQENLSGITYHPPSGLLYAVTNRPCKVHVLNKNGELQRTIDLPGFRDTESITYLYDNFFVIAEENLYNLMRVEITEATESITHDQAVRFNLAEEDDDNNGIEGVAWSQQFGLFAVNETPPTLLHQPVDEWGMGVDLSGLLSMRLKVRDYAGLSVLPGKEDKLLILSESSDSLHVVDMQGRELSRLSLRAGKLGLIGWLWQPEGVAVDNDGRIYVVGEPNQFLVLERRPDR